RAAVNTSRVLFMTAAGEAPPLRRLAIRDDDRLLARDAVTRVRDLGTNRQLVDGTRRGDARVLIENDRVVEDQHPDVLVVPLQVDVADVAVLQQRVRRGTRVLGGV